MNHMFVMYIILVFIGDSATVSMYTETSDIQPSLHESG